MGLLLCGQACWSQELPKAVGESGAYSRKNTFTLFTEYSPTSSHILMGQSRNRILVTGGGSYSRRLWSTRNTAFSYVAEVRPAVFIADPVLRETTQSTYLTGRYAGQGFRDTQDYTVIKCVRGSGSMVLGYGGSSPAEIQYSYVDQCEWRWTFGQAFVPAAAKYSFRTQKKLQPFATAFAGYLYTSRPVPVESAESFNFLFGVGAGLELYRTKTRSVSLEARYQHFSNKNTAESNPGTDNVMYRLSYSFGR